MDLKGIEVYLGALMRPSTAAFQTFLSTNLDAVPVDLYTISLPNGAIIRFNSSLFPLVVSSDLMPGSPLNYNATPTPITFGVGPGCGRSKAKFAVGVAPTKIDIIIVPRPFDLIGTYTWQAAAALGLFDGAQIELSRAFLPVPFTGSDTSMGSIPWFYGYVGQIEIGRSNLKFEVLSALTEIVQKQLPRRLMHTGCGHVFGDSMCLFDRTTLAHNVTAGTLSDQNNIYSGFTPSPANLYDSGTIKGLVGQNHGLTADIQQVFTGGRIVLSGPFVYPVVVGDTFQMLPGCDHSAPTCLTNFNNFIHYGGFDFIPPPEAAF